MPNDPASDPGAAAVAFSERYGGSVNVSEAEGGFSNDMELADRLLGEREVELIIFQMGTKTFALPILVVKEVVRSKEMTKLPSAPSYVPGVVDLRGRVTPVIRIRDLLGLPESNDDPDRYIVVCRHQGLQIGLLINAVASMQRAQSKDLDFNVASQLGHNAAFLMALMRSEEGLVSMLSIDRLTWGVLEDEGGLNA